MKNNFVSFVHLLHEIGMLAHTPRSGFAFLGSGRQSVAEHSFRMALTAYVLAELLEKMQSVQVDRKKLLLMCLLHDLPEARTGDLNYVNKRYVEAHEERAVADIQSAYPCGDEIKSLIDAYRENSTIESKLAHDADQLELLLCLKREEELGNSHAMKWFQKALERLQTEEAKELAREIQSVSSDAWWM